MGRSPTNFTGLCCQPSHTFNPPPLHSNTRPVTSQPSLPTPRRCLLPRSTVIDFIVRGTPKSQGARFRGEWQDQPNWPNRGAISFTFGLPKLATYWSSMSQPGAETRP